MADANKTEPGTPHKRQEAHKEGQVARSRDLPGAAAMLVAVGMLAWFSAAGVGQWRALMSNLLDQATRPEAQVGIEAFRSTFLLALGWSALIAAAAWLGSAAVAFQGGVVFSPGALLKWDRLRPDQNLKNLFSAGSLSRTGKSILPMAVMFYFTYAVLAENWTRLIRAGGLPVPVALNWLGSLALSLAWRGALVLLAWAGVDYFLQRHTYETSLKMTKQEVREENKELVGNPETRGRMRRLQRQMQRKRMMQQVAQATVVITNPTEYAVALRYDAAKMAAPIVVAKGRDLLAARIRARANSAGVPIVENRPLARALYRYVEIGAPIPGRLYAAVAEILAFLHRAQQRATRAAMRPMPRL